MAKQYRHFFLKNKPASEKFKTTQRGKDNSIIPSRDRATHSQKLLQQFETIRISKEQLNTVREAESISTTSGAYIEFKSKLGCDLVTQSLESISNGIRLLNIREKTNSDGLKETSALVYVPHGKERYFIKKIDKYQNENFKETGKPKNEKLVNSIEDVKLALLESLWTDKPNLIPGNIAKWCEVWLNIDVKKDIDNQLQHFITCLEAIEIAYKPNSIVFPERVILLICASKDQLIELMMQSELLAEFRSGQETAGFWMNETSLEQNAWVEDLLKRIEYDPVSQIKICLLDTGANNGHPLLQPILSDDDTLTVDAVWGKNDHGSKGGHGTMMAGIAGYGNLESELVNSGKVLITHKLCSVKLLPPPTQAQTPNELWGDMTSQAIAIAEIQNPDKLLLYCMAIASEDDVDRGRPSSWSGAIDKLAFGEGENPRLIIVSAGNVSGDDSWLDYPNTNFVSSVLNPAQSWNSLVVGAYTGKTIVRDLQYQDHVSIARENELSPYSTTSLVWERKWPIKPDVVFEGGNLLRSPSNTIASHPDLDLLSTSKNFTLKSFDTFCATSAATALASWFAAKIAYAYPEAWIETIRGLIVHSASWSQPMIEQVSLRPNNKGDYGKLMKVFGYGVPDLAKALYSNESALTYIVQEIIQPFSYKIKDGRKTKDAETNDIHFYNIPWPKDVLLSLENTPVKLRITLSYFIEPGLGEIGWKDKYRYQSFGLRFQINNSGDDITQFRKRVNKAAREENEVINSEADNEKWLLGSKNRSNGSIHSDIWEGTGAELATCNMIAVYPVLGWWRERKHLDEVEKNAKYSLIISLETPPVETDIYVVVKNLIEIPIEIRTK